MTVINQKFYRETKLKRKIFSILNCKLTDMFERFKDDKITKEFRATMATDPDKAIKDLKGSLGKGSTLNFNSGKSMDYTDAWICQQYMLRYTMAYVFEYYVMYLIALRQLDEPTAKAYSFGCGSGVDCLSLAYAKLKLGYDNEVSYRGIDLTDWAEKFDLQQLSEIDAEYYVDKEEGMLAFLKKDPAYTPNILFFPKLLSELDDETVTSFCKLLKDLKSEELIVCVSYRSPETMSEDFEKACPIITALEEKYEREELNGLDEIYDILNISGSNVGQLSLTVEDNGIFRFIGDSRGTKYSKIDGHFTIPQDIWDYIGVPGISDICANADSIDDCQTCYLNDQCPHSAIANVGNMCFQIIHLKRKPE